MSKKIKMKIKINFSYPKIPKKLYDDMVEAVRSASPFRTGLLKRSIIPPKKCPSCGKRAVMWNEWNKVTQCHNCGEIMPDLSEKEVVVFT
jgi:hypothetical protein